MDISVFRRIKGVSTVVVLIAGLVLFVYTWGVKITLVKHTSKAIAHAASSDNDQYCEDVLLSDHTENPNSYLFISCGGFLD